MRLAKLKTTDGSTIWVSPNQVFIELDAGGDLFFTGPTDVYSVLDMTPEEAVEEINRAMAHSKP